MPYRKFEKVKDGKRLFCVTNVVTGKTYSSTTEEKRDRLMNLHKQYVAEKAKGNNG